jgi:pimeloyl-ACP methyl ester carboxylesterase
MSISTNPSLEPFSGATFRVEDRLIPSGDAGVSLFLRNKRRADLTRFSAERTLLIVHGGSQAVEVTFDLRLDGLSWADYIAARGWDVWLLDIRGFGRSTWPPEMDLPIDEAPPVATTADAWRDYEAAVQFVLGHRGLTRLNALGWSWGTIIVGGWASRNPDRIDRLVLFGPAWDMAAPAAAGGAAATPGYTRWTTAEALERLQRGTPPERLAEIFPAHWRAAWEAATTATDAQAHRYDPPRVRSPAGAFADIARSIATGQAPYEPKDIRAATLVITGEWDALTPRASALALFDALSGARTKRYVEIAAASHFAHLERNRLELFAAVQGFLEEADAAC